jgi:hypothetical protein
MKSTQFGERFPDHSGSSSRYPSPRTVLIKRPAGPSFFRKAAMNLSKEEAIQRASHAFTRSSIMAMVAPSTVPSLRKK